MTTKTKEPKINLLEALKTVVDTKNIDDSIVEGALKDALITAARKYLNIDKHFDVNIDEETNEISIALVVDIVDDYPDYDPSLSAEAVQEMDEHYMLIEQARDLNPDVQPGDHLEMELPVSAFGRQAIQTAKQYLIQRIRDAERSKIVDTYRNRIGSIVNGEVLRIESRNAIVSIGRQTEAVLPYRDQLPKERFQQGSSVKAVIKDVAESAKNGAQVILSRTSDMFLYELFRQEVPEIFDGTVEVKGVVRDPGFRAKISVSARDARIDPVGACVGMQGARVKAIVRELGNERIDIVHWNPDLITFIRHALSPANIVKYFEVPGTRRIVIVIADEDLAQAIGRNGQNVTLATRLVEHDLDVFGEKEWSEKSDEEKQKILTPRQKELVESEDFHSAENSPFKENSENVSESPEETPKTEKSEPAQVDESQEADESQV
ncbi:transcription termination factor NusA [uncultured Fibrobacter sp.]|uniref:transcription termination factor NusA n=1 Tax=uncultured Fibrobacter sp. TaxID=261512 RepID=UPI002803F47E|nr:transcription termination factor NusA [uncultured Fibrobacter sp.]